MPVCQSASVRELCVYIDDQEGPFCSQTAPSWGAPPPPEEDGDSSPPAGAGGAAGPAANEKASIAIHRAAHALVVL